MSLSKIIVKFGQNEFELVSIKDNNDELWMSANPFAKILNYSRLNKAVQQHVSAKNQKILEELRHKLKSKKI
ncbi:Baculovirus repeated ORF 8 [Trabala vishnou gigantina nucleopolyhedrovirus]|uniref:Baculovirus repeated ORF 8 n=1 Tax=Trabala vishnou gigantina nucleopolyhedrovirus TaxID=2863583 RepID=UPI002481DD37|nr:Baculovirus repeated ORF 8 [Trabala vishnou gigantina nucleopolyhedrovirus]QYC92788.1 Baculovirus repeated ORF 8 [Trabala vishnou gigantina nucleopolyhedrovirus]